MNTNIEYKKIFDLSPEAIIILNTEGQIIDLNNRLFDWLGYSADEVKGKSFLEVPFISSEGKVTAKENLIKRMKGVDIEPYNLEFISKDGSKKIGKVFATALKNEQNEYYQDLILISDVTEEQDLQSQLKKHMRETDDRQLLLSTLAVKLGSDIDFNVLMNETLKALGVHTQISRAYIFEDSENGELTSNAYEWTNEGVVPHIKDLQNIPYTSIGSWKEMLSKKGAINCSDISTLPKDIYDILAPQSIKSILVFPILENDEQIGFIGFDENEHKKEWRKESVNLLQTISGIIANTYIKKKAQDKLIEKISELEKVNKLMTGRELKMVELKKELKQHKEK